MYFEFITQAASRIIPDSKFKRKISKMYSRYSSLLGERYLRSISLRTLLDLKKLSIPYEIRGGMVRVLIEDFDILIYLNNISIVKEVFVEKVYLGNKLEEGDVVVDCGAHVGTFSLLASRIVGKSGVVIAIEPAKENLKILKRNIRKNRVKNIIIVPKALWSSRGKMRLGISEVNPGEHSLLHRNALHQNLSSEIIRADTLDNILRELRVRKVNFIKMDIEGAEIEALKGMERTLRKNVKLAIASYHIVNGRKTINFIIPFLRERGFKISVDKKNHIIHARK